MKKNLSTILCMLAIASATACHEEEWAPPDPGGRVVLGSPTETVAANDTSGTAAAWKMGTNSTILDATLWYNEDLAATANAAGSIVAAGSKFLGPPNYDYTIGVRRWAATGDGASWTKLINATPCTSCPGNETAYDVVVTPGGAIYIAAAATDIVGVGSGWDWRVSRLDPANGNELWTVALSSSPTGGTDQATGIAYDPETSTVIVVGQWGFGGAIARLRPDGTTIGFDTTSLVSVTSNDFSVAVDPTPHTELGDPRQDGQFYVAAASWLSKHSINTGGLLNSWTFTNVTLRSVAVDTIDHSVCLAGGGNNLASPTSGADGWAQRRTASGAVTWTNVYAPTTGAASPSQIFTAVDARRGGGGCVAAGEAGAVPNTDALTVSWDGVGTLTGALVADDSAQANPSWDIEMSYSGPFAGKALTAARAWSVNGGSVPQPLSYDGWLRWITVQ